MKVAIVTGGTSSERDIALLSAQTVQESLEGRFELFYYDLPGDLKVLFEDKDKIDCAIPVFHGRGGEGGEVQGMLTMFGIPFIFSDVGAHAIGLDKALTKTLVASLGYSTPDWVVLEKNDVHEFLSPVVVKPLDGGSSLGIMFVNRPDQMKQALENGRSQSDRILVERQVKGREFTVSIVEVNGEKIALPVVEICSKNTFFDYESKYNPSLAQEICPANISEDLTNRLKQLAIDVHVMIGARHLSRSDMIVDEEGEIWFLEINTIPGLTSNSLTPKSIHAAGLTLSNLIESWIKDVWITKT